MTPAIAPVRPPFLLAVKRPEIVHVSALMLKPAEAGTLCSLQGECFGTVYPLLTALRLPRRRSYINDAGYQKFIEPPTVDKHIRTQCELLKQIFELPLGDYGISRAMLDVSYLDAQQGRSTLAEFDAILGAEKRDLIPAIGVDQVPAHALAARRWNKAYGTGLALRVRRRTKTRKGPPEGWPAPAEALDTLSECGGKIEETDLIIDAGHIANDAILNRSLPEVTGLLDVLRAAGPWRTVTVLSGAFPRSIGTLEVDKFHRLKRRDFILWKRLRHALHLRGLPCPIYGDYGVVFPIPANGGTPPLANLRYTDEHEYVVRRRETEPAMHGVCKAVSQESWFRGWEFSSGDEWIDRVARNLGGPGNGETWNQTGLQHHVAFVVRQLIGLT